MTNRVRPSTGHNEGEELTVEKAKRQTQFQRLTTPWCRSIRRDSFQPALLGKRDIATHRTATGSSGWVTPGLMAAARGSTSPSD